MDNADNRPYSAMHSYEIVSPSGSHRAKGVGVSPFLGIPYPEVTGISQEELIRMINAVVLGTQPRRIILTSFFGERHTQVSNYT